MTDQEREDLKVFDVTLYSAYYKKQEAYNDYKIRFLNISPKIEYSEWDDGNGEICKFTLNPWKVDTVAEYYRIMNKMISLSTLLSAHMP